jgi:hypothetical protein
MKEFFLMAKMPWQSRARLAAILPPQDVMILEAFQSDVYVQGKVDVQNEPLYDTFAIAQGVAVTENSTALFTNVGPASGKTLGQTNLSQSRRLPAPEAFSVLGIRLYWNENVGAADILAIVGNTVTGFAFEFFLGQKCYNRAPLWYYAAGGGFVNYNPVAAQDFILNGVPDRNGMHKLAIPLVIENQGEFYARLTGNAYNIAGANGFQLMCLLDGLHARGVQ